ncbi:hypothetical protein MSAN_01092100 [Mycena sanguinolenta]|uniref:BTB domain-containing protein n=1 Tax=Mycena sanguinolenta TaxID=230812 RepID=A0A8H6YNE4_9AGAR|nr:hypothetical protein MSAN_01092100 [Mycena sanguinolenta]
MSVQTPIELVRSTDFWFDDGTIILQVGNTLYRVYRGLLASRSTVFHDTFSMPQPESTMEEHNQIEGCPVVQLHDKERDFTHFLKALHHYGSYKGMAVSGVMELSSVLRLSDKYDVATLRESMVSILCDIYPSSLDEWLKRDEAVPPGYRIARQDCLTVLNLARELNIRSILPGAMYLVAVTQGLSVLYGGPGKRIRNVDDRKRYTLAFPELMLARRRVAATFLIREEEVDDCENEEGECDTERFCWLAEDLPSEPDPLKGELYWNDFDVCSPCLEQARETYNEAREELWDSLPDIFDLGTWEELLA